MMRDESPLRSAFHDKLELLTLDLAEMGELVASALDEATQSLLTPSAELAAKVIAQDEAVDALNSAVERHCIELIALESPVALDLRLVIGALRISASLERMGDLAVHVAKQARMRFPEHAVPSEVAPMFADMGRIGSQVARKAVELVRTRDIDSVGEIEAMDSEVDRLHEEIFAVLDGPSWSHDAKTTVDLTLLSRYYERYSDHAVSVAKRVVATVTGSAYADVTLEP